MKVTTPPVVLCFSALDPSGRGGIQADIETIASLGGHCAPVATATCTSGAAETTETIASDPTLVIEQARSVLEDMSVQAIKVGFLGSVTNAEAIHSILSDYPNIPMVMHPAFCLWDKTDAEQADLPAAITSLLLPQAEIMVATIEEAYTLVKEGDTVHATAQALMSHECTHVLLKHANGQNRKFQSTLYNEKGVMQEYGWQTTPPTCHGTSSTLTSAVAAYRGHECPVQSAVEHAQNFTWQAMSHAWQLGFGKPTPNRLHWVNAKKPDDKDNPSGNTAH